MRTRGRIGAGAALALAVPLALSGLGAPAGAVRAALPPGLATVQALPALPGGAAPAGAEPATARLSMRVVLEPRDPERLAGFVAAVSTPASPSFRHFLPKGAFATRFGPTESAIDAVTSLLRRDRLAVTGLSASHLVLSVSGTAGAFAEALHAPLLRWRLPSGAVGYRLGRAPRLPSGVAVDVAGVVGVSSLVAERSFALRPRPSRGRAGTGRRAAVASRTSPSATGPVAAPCNELLSQTIPPGGTGTAFTPYELGEAYGLTTAWSSGDDGAGRTVAVEEFAPYSMSDVVGYDQCNGIPTGAASDPMVHDVLVDGGTSPGSASGSDEPTLDIEELRTLAPGANVDVYLGPNNVTGPIDTLQRIATDDAAQAVSISWGICEAFSDHADETPIFEQMAAQGQSVFAASGDSGSSDCLGQSPPDGPVLAAASVDDPAAQPLVTGVGGLTVTSLAPLEKSVWNDCVRYGEPGCLGDATGGGISTAFRRPAWQVAPGVPTGTQPGATARLVPDLSVIGDPSTGMIVDFEGSFQPIGGTSMGAPLMAALDVDAAQSCGATTLGPLNPLLYAMARHGGDFVDVTGGSRTADNNAVAPATLRAHEYFAHPGYDMASGIGTPAAATFLPALCDGPATATAVPTTPVATATWRVTFHTGAATLAPGAALTVTAPPGTVLPASTAAWTVASPSSSTPSAVRVSAQAPNVARLTLAAALAPVDLVTLTADGVRNPRAVGTGQVVVGDAPDHLAITAPLALDVGVPSAARSTVAVTTHRATVGGSEAVATVTVRDAIGDAILGARVAVAVTGGGHADLLGVTTSDAGTATFSVRDDRVERAVATVDAGGQRVGAVAVQFVDPWSARRPRVLGELGHVLGAPAVAAWGHGWVALVRTAGGRLALVAPHGAALGATPLGTLAPPAATTPSLAAAGGWLYAAYRSTAGHLVVLRHPSGAPLRTVDVEDLTAQRRVPPVIGTPTLVVAGSGASAHLSVAVVTQAHLVDAVTASLRAPTRFAASSVSDAASLPASATGAVAQVPTGDGEGFVFRTTDGSLQMVAEVGRHWYANDLAESALLSVYGPDAIAGDPVATVSPLGYTVAVVTAGHRVDEFVGTFDNWSAEAIAPGEGGASPPPGHATLPLLAGTPVLLVEQDATVVVVDSTGGRLVELRSPGVADPWAAYDLTLLARVGDGAATGAVALPGRGESLLCAVGGALVEVRGAPR